MKLEGQGRSPACFNSNIIMYARRAYKKVKKVEMTYWRKGLIRLEGLMRLGLLLAAVMLTAGCSGGGDDPDSSGSGSSNPGGDSTTPIAFSAQQQDEQTITRAGQDSRAGTRASTPLEDLYIYSFDVWGYKNMTYNSDEGSYGDLQTVIPRYHVEYEENSANTTTSNSDGWEYVNKQTGSEPEQSIKYWDWSAKAYRFFGLTQAAVQDAVSWTETENPGGNPSFSATVDATTLAGISAAPYFSHLWFSTGNPTNFPTRQFGKPVQLEFLQPFAKVRIMFIAADQTVVLADLISDDPVFTFGPTSPENKIVLKGTFTVTYPLTGTGTTETWIVSPATNGVERPALTESNYIDTKYWYRVLPAKANDQGIYKLMISVNGEEKPCYVPAEYMEWLPGYSYTYIFKIVDEGGVAFGGVISAYTDWQTGKEADYSIYNW